ncbi:hypothetical protein [Chitinophaga sp. YIM B06452]|uniref:hypothetical protein n=1 Tax=Chitinophaga sp. YIM B06452 TaxID=3082158 RepID=UPI0031FEDCBE
MGRRKKINTAEDFEASENGQIQEDVILAKKKRGRPAKGNITKGLLQIMEREKKPIEVRSGALKGIFCDYSYDHMVAQNTTNNVRISSHVPVHADLTAAFKRLHVHLAVICEEIHADDIPDIDNLPVLNEAWDADDSRQPPLAAKLAKYAVSSFKIVGNGENEGVVLTGGKLLSTTDEVGLTTPVTKYQSEYPFVNELRIAVDDLVSEIEAYMNGKQAPPRQTEMVFADEDEFDDEEDI